MRELRSRLALAADIPLEQGLELARTIRDVVGVVKVGLSLFVEHGPRAVHAFRSEGFEVFLDLKLHDIPKTVELAAAGAAGLGAKYLTVHGFGGSAMIRAAVSGAQEGALRAGEPSPVVLGVTVLTSLDEGGLLEVGVARSPRAQVLALAGLAVASGAQGLVCAVEEVGPLRRDYGQKVVLVTPGIRPAGVHTDDQARVDTPAAAIRAGANLLVVGRAITAAPDPQAAAFTIGEEIAAATAL